MVLKIAVIGAGINGLACAVKIKEKYRNAQVVLISSDFSPNTTGDGSGGFWNPYLCGRTPGSLLAKWGGETYQFLHQLWLEGGYDICLMPAFILYRNKKHWLKPEWSKDVFGFHGLDDKDLEYFGDLFSGPFASGYTFTSFVFSGTLFMSYLYQRFKSADGEVLQAKVFSLRDPLLKGFNVVVNCTGLNARFLVPDNETFPYRGQVIRVTAPWVNHTVIDEDNGHYIIPNSYNCVLGGTHQENDYSTKLDDRDTEFILTGCKSIMPSLQSAEIYNHWVGLRPGRHTVRLEAEQIDGKLIIHNYGHGGCGLTLFWGCATNVLELLHKHLGFKVKEKCKL